MAEKMTAVWLILLTIIVCSAVPGILIYVTMVPAANVAGAFQMADSVVHATVLGQ